MELGISSFGEVRPEGVSGGAAESHRSMQELIAEAKMADSAGLDVYALGEHHRPDFIVSAPEVALAAVAAVTKHIRLSSSVTVLSSADPVRVFQDFATLDLVSGGRAEIMAGRGSFTESFPLFGYSLQDYDELFVEKLELLMQINRQEVITWKGKFRPPIFGKGIYPRPLQASLPIWQAVGGTTASAVRAGKLNLPMMIAILGGRPDQYVPFIGLYRKSAQEAGHDPAALQLGINSQFHIAENSDQAADEFYPSYEKLMNRVGKERGWSPITRDQFEIMRLPEGPLFVGNVQEVTDKIIYQHGLFRHTRFLGQLIKGYIDHAKVLKAIELFGTKVAPAVKEALGGR
ncbi:LLM class flavin-dependent oxidoreductase [Chitinophaga sp. XS-30]|uniref:LLM class flavin-dependent oxidoreductase n=1 Tax=Chitinophaga sp. XS-30 TaxID=2604421 RepID=UPI0011DDE270|nr:LLM class flavin-dependent oxidoreductase [Chitinophaga sp. XS-30]QEH42910.1 LLM class flavin-dependent oxidoreductase [Chitinophaga sp. XS-30]